MNQLTFRQQLETHNQPEEFASVLRPDNIVSLMPALPKSISILLIEKKPLRERRVPTTRPPNAMREKNERSQLPKMPYQSPKTPTVLPLKTWPPHG